MYQECIKDSKRFKERIPRHKILNFANECASYSLITVEMVRGIFGSILFLAPQRKIDMAGRDFVISTYTYITTT